MKAKTKWIWTLALLAGCPTEEPDGTETTTAPTTVDMTGHWSGACMVASGATGDLLGLQTELDVDDVDGALTGFGVLGSMFPSGTYTGEDAAYFEFAGLRTGADVMIDDWTRTYSTDPQDNYASPIVLDGVVDGDTFTGTMQIYPDETGTYDTITMDCDLTRT